MVFLVVASDVGALGARVLTATDVMLLEPVPYAFFARTRSSTFTPCGGLQMVAVRRVLTPSAMVDQVLERRPEDSITAA